MELILEHCDVQTRSWASTLTVKDVAHLLTAVYQIPTLLDSLREEPFTLVEPKNNAAAVIGQSGEHRFKSLCCNLPINYKLQDTTKQGKKGDFIINFTKDGSVKRCLVDIKNYTSSIPKKEIDKFYEDLTFGTYDAGLMISYQSKFTGIAEHIYTEDACLSIGKIPVMFLVSDDDLLILQVVQFLFMKMTTQDKKDVDLSKIEALIEIINSALVNSADTRRLLSELSTHISKSIQKCQENLIMHEAHVKRTIREMSNCVTNMTVNKVMQLVPNIDSRDDNVDIMRVCQAQSDIKSLEILNKVCKNDKVLVQEILELNWTDLLSTEPNEVSNDKMSITITPMKTKTTITIAFASDTSIVNSDLDSIVHKFNKDEELVCTLDTNLVEFIKKYK